MKINVHAGHNPDGKIACGAVGLKKESTEARKVKKLVIQYLKSSGHTVYDCTCDNGTSQNDVLKKIVNKCNHHNADLDVSIHFNSGANDKKGNGKSTGVEVLIQNSNSKAKPYATKICNEIAKLGFKNRGVKVRDNLYVLNKTKAPALLIECCFVDDKDDIKLYSADTMAKAIVKGITGKTVTVKKNTSQNSLKSYSGTFPKGTLKKGSKGNEVKNLQKFLNWYGNYGLKVDGEFGTDTGNAVERFQKATGLTADRIWGAKSLAKAKSIKK